MPHVLIYSPNTLFRDGLRRLIGDVAVVRVFSDLAALEAWLGVESVDTVVIDMETTGAMHAGSVFAETVTRLLRTPTLTVIQVNLETDAMQIYRHEEIGSASVEALRQAILHNPKEVSQ